jgi:Sulfatase
VLTRLSPRGLDVSSLPWHSLAVAVFPVLFLFAENAEQQVTLTPLWVPLLLSLIGAVGLLLLTVLITRDPARGGLLATLLLVLFFSFGHVYNLIGAPIGASRWLLAAGYALVAVGLGTLIWRGGRWVPSMNRFLNVVAVLLVAFNAFRVANYASISAAAAEALTLPSSVELQEPEVKPDIYYIILDRYANADTLSQIYEFDNEPFLRQLEARGFTVAREAWANYFKTALSVYASLSMHYIDADQLNVDMSRSTSFTEVHAALRDHLPVPRALKSMGYGYVHLGNWWEPTATNADADVSLRFQESAEFSSALWSTTMLSLIWPPDDTALGTDDDGETVERRDLHRSTVLYAFERLEEAAGRPGPTFVFAHILVPHPPYVFAADGSFPSQEEVRAQRQRDNYVRQLRWTNDRVTRAIDRLMAHAPGEPEPIIILQADEGPWPPGFTRDQRNFQWLDASPEEIQEKFGILNAVRLPGVDPSSVGFTDHTSPVNEFRVVFDAYFDAGLGTLPDITYLSPDYGRMYDFVVYPRP